MAEVIRVLIELFLANVPTGFDFLMAPFRIPITIGALDTLPWWIVMVVAATSAAIGSLPLYLLTYLGAKHPMVKKFSEHPFTAQYHALRGRKLFVWLIILNTIPFVDWYGTGLAGWKRYPFRRSFSAMVIGRCLHNLPFVLGGKALLNQPWFQAWLGFTRQPAVLLGLFIVLVAFAIIATRQINKAQIEYNQAQAVK